jgi:hypothetical protein
LHAGSLGPPVVERAFFFIDVIRMQALRGCEW